MRWLDMIFMMMMGALVGLVIVTTILKIGDEITDFVKVHREAHVRHLVSELEKLFDKRAAENGVASGKPESISNREGADANPA